MSASYRSQSSRTFRSLPAPKAIINRLLGEPWGPKMKCCTATWLILLAAVPLHGQSSSPKSPAIKSPDTKAPDTSSPNNPSPRTPVPRNPEAFLDPPRRLLPRRLEAPAPTRPQRPVPSPPRPSPTPRLTALSRLRLVLRRLPHNWRVRTATSTRSKPPSTAPLAEPKPTAGLNRPSNLSTSRDRNYPETNGIYSNRVELGQVVVYVERLPDRSPAATTSTGASTSPPSSAPTTAPPPTRAIFSQPAPRPQPPVRLRSRARIRRHLLPPRRQRHEPPRRPLHLHPRH